MIKRLLIASSAAPDAGSGISSYAKDISEQFSKRGYVVHYYSPKPKIDKWYIKYNIKHGLYADQYSDAKSAIISLIEYIKENKIEACINNDNPFLQSAMPVLNCTMIAVGHLGRTSVASLACYNSNYIDYIITISNDMQQTFIKKYNQNISKVPIVYNGVTSQGEKKVKSDDKITAFFGGGSNKRKGADILIKSIQKKPNEWKKFEINWCGRLSDNDKKILLKYENIIVHGQVERSKAREILEGSDVLLFPSKDEGCPMMMLEAMSTKIIPISSNGIGAMETMITSGEDGFICNLNNWGDEALDCLKYLSKYREILDDMSNNVFKKFQSMFTVEHTIDRLEYFLNHPVITRPIRKKSIMALKWHRPFRSDGLKAPIIDRLAIRFGYLRKYGKIMI